ncbi:MAG: DUF2480 family protein [Bacteroidetes bacterium]|nr:DUF2480 family protein [Bacteroidota bacterium]
MQNIEQPLVNRVAGSGLVTLRLEDYFPKEEMALFDLKDFLFMGLILKEKDFREALAVHDWAQYEGKNLAVFCSADAIIPTWAYMLVAVCAAPFAADIFQGTAEEFYKHIFQKALNEVDVARYAGQRVVVKGCSDKPVPPSAYVELTRKLQPHAQSIMFGEPCSTVPIFKKPKQ